MWTLWEKRKRFTGKETKRDKVLLFWWEFGCFQFRICWFLEELLRFIFSYINQSMYYLYNLIYVELCVCKKKKKAQLTCAALTEYLNWRCTNSTLQPNFHFIRSKSHSSFWETSQEMMKKWSTFKIKYYQVQ